MPNFMWDRTEVCSTSADGQQGDIESATTQIKDEHIALLVLLHLAQTIGNGGCEGRLKVAQRHVKKQNKYLQLAR